MDGGSVGRWLDDNFRKVYRHFFAGNWRKYNAFDAAYRPEVREVDSPAVCSRTYQGWRAFARQGKGDGTPQLIPFAESMIYFLLHAIQDDVPQDDLCGTQPGRAHSISDQYHSLLIQELSSILLLKNTAYLERQALNFVAGKTPPDFPADDFEVDFAGRGPVADLTELGRSQLGITEALYKSTLAGTAA